MTWIRDATDELDVTTDTVLLVCDVEGLDGIILDGGD